MGDYILSCQLSFIIISYNVGRRSDTFLDVQRKVCSPIPLVFTLLIAFLENFLNLLQIISKNQNYYPT